MVSVPYSNCPEMLVKNTNFPASSMWELNRRHLFPIHSSTLPSMQESSIIFVVQVEQSARAVCVCVCVCVCSCERTKTFELNAL